MYKMNLHCYNAFLTEILITRSPLQISDREKTVQERKHTIGKWF